jgi:hypothetical protein
VLDFQCPKPQLVTVVIALPFSTANKHNLVRSLEASLLGARLLGARRACRKWLTDILFKLSASSAFAYRWWLVRARGASWRPKPTAAPWMNQALKTKAEWLHATNVAQQAGLNLHPCTPKNWDHLAAVAAIRQQTGPDAKVLDAGGESYSTIVDWLFLYSYQQLFVLNYVFESDFKRGPVHYQRGDITLSPYPDGFFDAVTCMSVIEHGVPLDKFLVEMKRILRPGGLLIVSTDYWPTPLPTEGKKAYGADVKVFTELETRAFVEQARALGFEPTNPLDYTAAEKCVLWPEVGLDFTFIVFAFVKKTA